MAGRRVLTEHDSDDLTQLREERVRTRYLMCVVNDDAQTATDVLISASSIRWITAV